MTWVIFKMMSLFLEIHKLKIWIRMQNIYLLFHYFKNIKDKKYKKLIIKETKDYEKNKNQ